VNLKDFIISKNIKRSHRNVRFHNFETAENVSVLYCIKNKSDYEEVKQFVKELEKKGLKTETLSYVYKPEEIGHIYFGMDNNNFFSDKHISKFGNIKESCIHEFLNKKTDILINLCCDELFFTEYIFALSKADFKVSGIQGCKHSDLNINLQQTNTTRFLIDQITYYLSIIKKA
jgi:hypothetical protein